MDRDELTARTRKFAVRVVKLVDALPNTFAGRAIGNQLVKCGTSVAANYRASRRARSRKEFSAKIGIVSEEADESEFWIGFIIEANLMASNKVSDLHQESEELMRIFAKMRQTSKQPKKE